MKTTPLLKSYRAATRMLSPVLPLWLKRRAAKGKEDPERLAERQGISEYGRPAGHLIWLHAASVGESQMLMPLITRMTETYPDHPIIITTGTLTSAELLAKQLPANVLHQFAPADHPKAVKNFLDHWQPDMAIFAESELWPNMILSTKNRGIPMALINARMSAASMERWAKRGKKSANVLLSSFDLILAADKATADGLSWLLGKEIEASGNLKDAAQALPVDTDKLAQLKTAIGKRKVWLAASTHEGEDGLITKAALDVKRKYPSVLLILAPRHPERAKAVKEIFTKAGLNTLRRSSRRMPSADTDVYMFDSIGHMGLAYRLASVSLIGGSLCKGLSGHNPLEPARLGSAIITGPHIASFADTYMALLAFNGAKRILNNDDLAPAVIKLLGETKHRAARIKAAQQYAQSRDGVLDFVWEKLDPLLAQKDVL